MERKECLKPLAVQIALGNCMAIRLVLRQKPGVFCLNMLHAFTTDSAILDALNQITIKIKNEAAIHGDPALVGAKM